MNEKIIATFAAFMFATSALANEARIFFADPGFLETYSSEAQVVESSVALINDTFNLKEELVFVVGGQEGPLFNPSEMEIIVPYDFIDSVKQRFKRVNYEKTGISVNEATEDALMHALFHEFAHAIIHMYEIPVVGKEEDAADSLAALLLIEFFDNGQEIALSAADLFDLQSEDTVVLSDEDFWDEHSLDDQRYFSTLCYVYGSNPENYHDIKESISAERAELCIEEYEILKESWFQLLEPYFKH